MLYLTKETVEETNQRLLSVIASSSFEIYSDYYVYEEFPSQEFQAKVRIDALAIVRDNNNWSQLISTKDKSEDSFKLFSFHFVPGFDNSGFVGWLASYLKQRTGTGVTVLCGYNSLRGGIFDYWGCPAEIGETVIAEINTLMNFG